jgi:hypothetical protein
MQASFNLPVYENTKPVPKLQFWEASSVCPATSKKRSFARLKPGFSPASVYGFTTQKLQEPTVPFHRTGGSHRARLAHSRLVLEQAQVTIQLGKTVAGGMLPIIAMPAPDTRSGR